MDFIESTEYLLSLGNEVETMKLGLDNIRTLLAELGDPQTKYKKVQVAGTNGKGSVCAFLDSICREADIKTGLYTSPHLISIAERVKIDGNDISENEFARLATRVRETSERLVNYGTLEHVPTYFEQVTAIGLLAFADANVELAILETGLGGRYDAVTAAEAEIAVITRIDLDHQEYLGDTIEEIAAEKAAIITEKTQSAILGEQPRDVMRLLRQHCRNLDIEPLNDEYEPWRILPADGETVTVVMSLYQFPPVRLGLRGRHQVENAQTALQTARALLYDGFFLNFTDAEEEDRIVAGLENARHPGRIEYVGRFLLDGAHNPSGAKALRAFLNEFVPDPVTLIFGAMKDKDVSEILETLLPKAARVIFTEPSNTRSAKATDLLATVEDELDGMPAYTTNSVEAAIEIAQRETPGDDLILVTGSLYLTGEAKKMLQPL
jgi:dihydrofolate synthase/folylpolyglutamate synthase